VVNPDVGGAQPETAPVKKKKKKRAPPPWLQTPIYVLELIGYVAFTGLIRALPIDWASGFGGWVLKIFGPLTSIHKTADMNIRLAFPDMSVADRKRLLTAQWENTGRVFAEFPILDRLTPASDRIEMVNGERLDAIREAGKPVVFVSGHFASFEIMPATILHYGIDCEITYRAANNPFVESRLRKARARYGVKRFAPKGGEGARDMLVGMKEGASVALMNDQKFNRGLAVPFFGHDAYTAPGPSRLALRFDTVLQPMTVRRTKGARFQVTVHEPIELVRTKDRAFDIEQGVRRITAFVENEVRTHPEDWFWVHKRWPNELYAALDSAAGASEAASR
jgi:KDO2-lipid IV(A) lauroyltransferase